MTLTQITEKGIKDGEIVNADINASAAIAKSKLASLDIVNGDINASAAIAGSKIDPSFTSNITITNTQPKIFLTDSNNTSDFSIQNENGNLNFYDETNNISRIRIISTGKVGIGTTSPSFKLDIAADNTSLLRLTNTNETSHGSHNCRFGAGGGSYQNLELFGSSYLFKTYDGSSEDTRMTLDSSGRLLLGTTGVGSKGAGSNLQIQSSNTAASAITIKNRSSHNDYGFIYFTDDDASEDLVQIGVQRTAASEGDLAIYTNDGSTSSQERLRIDSIGHVEISTEVAANGNVGLQLDTSNTSNASSLLFQAGGENRAQLLVQRVAGDGGHVSLQVARTDNSNALVNVFTTTCATSGDTTPDLTLTGNLVVSNGNGIDFTANTGASGMTSELLDHYEEGTWTPAVTSGLAAGVISYNSRSAKYTRVGNTVYFTFHININSANLDSGALKFGGLPFTSANVSHTAGGAWKIFTNGNIDAGATYKVIGNSTDIQVVTGAGDNMAANATSINAGHRHMAYWGFYYV